MYVPLGCEVVRRSMHREELLLPSVLADMPAAIDLSKLHSNRPPGSTYECAEKFVGQAPAGTYLE